jgi:hypothetical protein
VIHEEFPEIKEIDGNVLLNADLVALNDDEIMLTINTLEVDIAEFCDYCGNDTKRKMAIENQFYRFVTKSVEKSEDD